jgi:DNA-directed RNA polymerase specialized sigma24 family protein
MHVRGSSPLDASTFGHLLARLHEDPDQAGERYEDLRHTLLRFFEWRGVVTPDVAADESLDRLGRRLASGESVVDLRAYALGIARLVALEHHRRPEARATELDALAEQRLVAATPVEREGPGLACLDSCLEKLDADQRAFIEGYYSGTGRARIDGRDSLARRLGLSPNAQRLRAQRLRGRLEACVRNCLSANGLGDPA